MARGKQKTNEWWDQFDKWEEEWKKKRKKERLEDARKLRQAEKDYDRSLHSLSPLTTSPQPKKILATQSREPGVKRVPLKAPLDCPLIMPARIVRIDRPNLEEAMIFFRIEMENKEGEILEPAAFQIKKVIEYLVNERMLFFLQLTERGSFLIRVAGDKNAPPLFEVSSHSREAIHIRVLERSIVWSPGYVFNIHEILKGLLERLQRELE